MQGRGQFDTLSNDGKNRTALIRIEPGRRRRMRVRSDPLASAIILACAALHALPLQT